MLAFAVPAFALTQKGNGSTTDTVWISGCGNTEIGVSKDFGGSNTYGFSWADPEINTARIKTRVIIGNVSFPWTYGVGYVQSSQDSRPNDVNVSEKHGKY